MTGVVVAATMLAGLGGAFYLWYEWQARQLVVDRLTNLVGLPSVIDRREAADHRIVRGFPSRYRWLAPVIGAAAGSALWSVLAAPMPIAVALGVLIGVMASLVEAYAAERQEDLIETQLAASIDLLVGSLRAGAGLLAAFESALQEAELPLRPYFQEVAGRIRLGDDPRSAVSDLQARVPLETFRLFATTLAIHWEVGGSLATTLGTVGRTIRDRIELSRRVRAQGVESNASVAVVLAISYVLAFLMWRTNPDRLEAFVQTGLGTGLVAGAIALQATGLIWMSRLSRSQF